MSFSKICSILCLCALLFGCETTKPKYQVSTIPRVPIDYAMLDKAMELPTGTVRGQAFLRQRGGGVVKGAGCLVTLNPVNAVSQQFVDVIILNNEGLYKTLDPVDVSKSYLKYCFYTECDADGNFSFSEVPSGEYYIYTTVEWEIGTETQGGWLLASISVKENEETVVMLNDFTKSRDWWDGMDAEAINAHLNQ